MAGPYIGRVFSIQINEYNINETIDDSEDDANKKDKERERERD